MLPIGGGEMKFQNKAKPVRQWCKAKSKEAWLFEPVRNGTSMKNPERAIWDKEHRMLSIFHSVEVATSNVIDIRKAAEMISSKMRELFRVKRGFAVHSTVGRIGAQLSKDGERRQCRWEWYGVLNEDKPDDERMGQVCGIMEECSEMAVTDITLEQDRAQAKARVQERLRGRAKIARDRYVRRREVPSPDSEEFLRDYIER